MEPGIGRRENVHQLAASRPRSSGVAAIAAIVVSLGLLAAPALAKAAAVPPSSPGNVIAVAHDGSAEVTFSAPTADGGAPITSYTVTSIPPAATVTVPAATTDVVVGGLANGVAYTFTVHATNSAGDGPDTGPTAPVTPTAGSKSAVISFGWGRFLLVAILALGLGVAWVLLVLDRRMVERQQNKLMPAIEDARKRGSPLTAEETHLLLRTTRGTTGLTRTSLALGLLTLVGIALVALLIGDASRVNDAVKTFFAGLLTVFTTVIGFYFGSKTAADAAQSTGPAAPAAAAPAAAPGPKVPPDAPENVDPQPKGGGVGVVTVSFDPPVNQGDAPVTSYTATARSNDGTVLKKTNISAPIEMPGLTVGANYTFTVHATNAAGAGAESAPPAEVEVT